MTFDQIQLLVLDVDGVLTNGIVDFGPEGSVGKGFCVQDGCAIGLWMRAGGGVALLTGRNDASLRHRAEELGLEWVRTGVADKLAGYDQLLIDTGYQDDQVCYIGDDLPDMAPLRRCGFSMAVRNAAAEVKRASDHVLGRRGGDAAVAEAVELLLRKQNRWSVSLALRG